MDEEVVREAQRYVREMRQAGHSPQDIITALVAAGWPGEAAAGLLNAAALPAAPPPYAQAVLPPTGTRATGLSVAGVPEEVRGMGFNWAALLLCVQFPTCVIWALGHRVWVALLCVVPIMGFILAVWLGATGYVQAWNAGDYRSVEEFRAKELAWQRGAFVWWLFVLLLWFIAALIDPSVFEGPR